VTLRIDRLSSAEIEVEVLPEAGARLHRVRAFGHDLMRTPEDPAAHFDDPFYAGGYHMLPWTNRIAPGPTRVGSRTGDQKANFKDGTAIHGQHYISPWQVERDGVYTAAGGDDASGWPWAYGVRVEVAVDEARLRISHSVTNLSADPMPAGAGIHPWFLTPVEVRIPAHEAIASNTEADAPHEPLTAALDFGSFRELPTGLDAAWANVDQPLFSLRWPDHGITADLRASAPTLYVVAANPGTVDAVAVEPQTHAPWGMRRLLDGERGGLTVLEPGATLTLQSTLEFSRAEEANP
jgi:aldose 1-epimerase